MKTKLLLLALVLSAFGFAQSYDTNTYFISEIVASPPNSSTAFINESDNDAMEVYQTDGDETLEYYEFRGTPNATIEDDIYFISIDGDDEAVGNVKDAINLSGLTFGSNGILVIVCDITMNTGTGAVDLLGADISGTKFTNPFATDLASSGANVVTVQLFADDIEWTDERNADNTNNTGDGTNETLNKFNLDSSMTTPAIGYDGTFNDQSATYMIVKSTSGNPKGELVDADGTADGVLDGAATAWTIYDAVTILDDDDTIEYAYSNIIFVEDPDGLLPAAQTITFDPSLTPSIITLNQYPNYVARQGLSTGYAATLDATNNDDWMAGRVNSLSYPDWKFSGTGNRNFPSAQVTNNNLSDFAGLTLGEVNVDFNSPPLSTKEFLANDLNIYPNPAQDFITIQSKNTDVSTVEVYSLVGQKVISETKLTNDRLNISNLTRGVYLLKIVADETSLVKKIIVE